VKGKSNGIIKKGKGNNIGHVKVDGMNNNLGMTESKGGMIGTTRIHQIVENIVYSEALICITWL
jgi:hypothetical protein